MLPRVREAGAREMKREDSLPSTGNGQSTTYKSSADVNGNKGTARLSVALDSGEDVG